MNTYRLPWPPSVNHQYRRGRRGRLVLTDAAEAFRAVVAGIVRLAGAPGLSGPVAVVIEQHPPAKRTAPDLDNTVKPLLDALQRGGAFLNDRQVCRLEITRRDPVPGGELVVTVGPWEGEGDEQID